MTVNLRHLVRDYLDKAETLDWQEIADNILVDLDPADYEAVLAQALPIVVQDTARKRSSGSVALVSAPPAKHVPSTKVQMIRDAHARSLEEVYATADGRKRLGDFTLADIEYQADLCQRKAKELHARGKSWKQLATALAQSGASTVRDLDASSASILKEVAA